MPASSERPTNASAVFSGVLKTCAIALSGADPKVIAPNASREMMSPVFPRRVYCMKVILEQARKDVNERPAWQRDRVVAQKAQPENQQASPATEAQKPSDSS